MNELDNTGIATGTWANPKCDIVANLEMVRKLALEQIGNRGWEKPYAYMSGATFMEAITRGILSPFDQTIQVMIPGPDMAKVHEFMKQFSCDEPITLVSGD